jgi:hypothetical protein
MRSSEYFYWEPDHVSGGNFRHTVLVVLVACAAGAAASAAVILPLVDTSTTQSGASAISPRAIVRNVSASEANRAAQDQSMIATPPHPEESVVSSQDDPQNQTEVDRQAVVHNQELSKHSRVVSRLREPYWRGRSVHAFSPVPRFGTW